jgi:GT2 family glycosyltransferase
VVSIVTPSYNHGRFIRATLESVLAQDYPNVEYIVMDGGSRDETASIVKDYGSRLKWISEPDRGQSHAINKGFRMARGSILFWLNSDDLILPGAVRNAVNALEENPSAGAVYGEGYLIDEEGKTTRRFPSTEPFNLWKLVHLSDYILQQTVYFQRAAIEDVGYLREDLHFALDWDLLIRIGNHGPLHYIPEYMGCLREHSSAKSFSGGGRRAREIARVLGEHTGMLCAEGSIVYGLETYSKIWCDAVEAAMPRVIAKPVQWLIGSACGYAIGRTVSQAQGWYGDQWATERLHYTLPAGAAGILVLAGWIPPAWTRNQKLTILDGRRKVAQREFFGGDFLWRVPIPQRTRPLELEIRATRSFVPALSAQGVDTRRLSYVLRSVRFEDRTQKSPNLERCGSLRFC